MCKLYVYHFIINQKVFNQRCKAEGEMRRKTNRKIFPFFLIRFYNGLEVKDKQSCTLIIRFTKRNCKAKCESLIPVTNYRSLLLKSVYSQSVVHGLEVQHPHLNHFASLGFVNLLFKNESNVKIHVFHVKSNISTKTKNT